MLKLNQSMCLRHDNFFYQKNLAINRVNTLFLVPRRVFCCVDTSVKKKCLFPYLFLGSNHSDSTVSLIKDPLIPGSSYNKNVLRFDESPLVVCIDTEYNKRRFFTIQVILSHFKGEQRESNPCFQSKIKAFPYRVRLLSFLTCLEL